MNVSLAQRSVSTLPFETALDGIRDRHLRSLITLFALYAVAVLAAALVADGPDFGCILGGIAGHVLFQSVHTARAWRRAAWIESARTRFYRRMHARA